MFIAFFYATVLELLLGLVSITIPILVDIIVFNLLIEALKEFICFSSLISRYALTATGKPTLPIRLTNSLIPIKNHLLYRIYAQKMIILKENKTLKEKYL